MEEFQCDDFLLAIHPDCEEECSVCRHAALKVEARWALKDSVTLVQWCPNCDKFHFFISLL